MSRSLWVYFDSPCGIYGHVTAGNSVNELSTDARLHTTFKEDFSLEKAPK